MKRLVLLAITGLLLAAGPAAADVLVARYFFAVSKFTTGNAPNTQPGVTLLALPPKPEVMTLVVRAMDGKVVMSKPIADGKIGGTAGGAALPYVVTLAPATAETYMAKAPVVPEAGQYALEFWAPEPPNGANAPPRDTVKSGRGFRFKVFAGTWRFVARNWNAVARPGTNPMARPGTNPWPEPDPDGSRNADGSTAYRD